MIGQPIRTSFLILGFVVFTLPCMLAIGAEKKALVELVDEFFYPLEVTDAIPWGIVNVITQDQRGYIWIGTEKGLLRFDGYEYKVFRHDPNDRNTPAGDLVETLFSASDGKLWFSTKRGVSVFDPEMQDFTNFNQTPDHPLSGVSWVVTEQDQYMWFGTDQGLVRLDPLTGKTIVFSDEKKYAGTNISGLVYDGDRWLWVGGAEGLYRIDVNTLDREPKIETFPYRVLRLMLAADHRLWISTRGHGLFSIDLNDNRKPWPLQTHTSPVGTPLAVGNSAKPNVTSIVQVDGEIWAAVERMGILVFDATTGLYKKHLQTDALKEHSIRSNLIYQIFVDASGLMWLAYHNEGIDLHNTRNDVFNTVPLHQKIQTQSFKRIDDIAEDGSGRSWLIGRKFVASFDPKAKRGITFHDELVTRLLDIEAHDKSFGIGGITTIGADQMLIFMLHGAVIRYDLRSDKLSLVANLFNGECHALRQPSDLFGDFVWIPCFYKSKLLRLNVKDYSVSVIDFENETSTLLQRSMVLDASDNLWVATKNGLYKIPNASSKKTQPQLTTLQSEYVVGLLLDADHTLWVDTYQGLHRKNLLDPIGKFENISDISDMARDQIFGNMLEDDFGRIWGDEGMLDPVNLRFHKFQLANGFEFGPNWLAAYLGTKDGLMLFGSDNNLLIVDPEHFEPWRYKAPLVVTRQFIGGEEIGMTDPSNLMVKASSKSFSVDVAALDFSAPLNNKYMYFLDGFDEDWNYADAKHRRITYTNLAPGDYNLQVKGSNREGYYGDDVLSILISVMPAWYQTVWFKVLEAVALCGFIYGLIYLRSRQLKMRQEELEYLIQEQSEFIKDTQEQLLNSEKQASLGRLVRGVAHELNTPLGILLTGISMVDGKIRSLIENLKMNEPGDVPVDRIYQQIQTTTELLEKNVRRSIGLVDIFKSVAMDNKEMTATRFQPKAHIQMILDTYANSGLVINLIGDAALQISSLSLALSQIINELTSNAIRHAFELSDRSGDEVVQEAVLNLKFEVVTGIGKETNSFRLIVSDNGKGMSEQLVKKCFDPFVSERTQDLGLGLHILFNIVTMQLEGQVECRSELGVGTQLIVTFPL